MKIAQLEFKLTYLKAAVQYFNHYTTDSPKLQVGDFIILNQLYWVCNIFVLSPILFVHCCLSF